jgi:hypothetical protein
MFRGKIYVPKDRELRHWIVEQHHDTCVAGHAGCFKTLEMVPQTIGGLRCHNTLVSMSKHVICAIEWSCSTSDHPESSILPKLLRSDGMSLVSILSLNYQTPMGMMWSWMSSIVWVNNTLYPHSHHNQCRRSSSIVVSRSLEAPWTPCGGTSIYSLTFPVSHYVHMYSPWSLYISDHICTR